MSGWIKLHRSLLEWEWWDDKKATRLLLFLLCAVNHEEKKWKGVTIPAGSMVLSWETLSQKVGLTVQECRTSMKKLEKSQEVTRKTTNKYQLVTLVKWQKLQSSNSQTTSESTGKQQSTNKQLTTTKESKEVKEVKKKEVFNFKKELIDLNFDSLLVSDWLEVRKLKKARNTKTAFNGFIKEVKKTGQNQNDILRICVERSWSGFKAQWLKNIENGKSNTETREESLRNW